MSVCVFRPVCVIRWNGRALWVCVCVNVCVIWWGGHVYVCVRVIDGLKPTPIKSIALRHPHTYKTQVFIFCVNKREVVQEYMARSKWPSSVAVRAWHAEKMDGMV